MLPSSSGGTGISSNYVAVRAQPQPSSLGGAGGAAGSRGGGALGTAYEEEAFTDAQDPGMHAGLQLGSLILAGQRGPQHANLLLEQRSPTPAELSIAEAYPGLLRLLSDPSDLLSVEHMVATLAKQSAQEHNPGQQGYSLGPPGNGSMAPRHRLRASLHHEPPLPSYRNSVRMQYQGGMEALGAPQVHINPLHTTLQLMQPPAASEQQQPGHGQLGTGNLLMMHAASAPIALDAMEGGLAYQAELGPDVDWLQGGISTEGAAQAGQAPPPAQGWAAINVGRDIVLQVGV